jgi:hypothetical protein
MRDFLIVALLCVVPLISGRAVDETKSKCLVIYLKNHGFLGRNSTRQDLPLECVDIVNDARKAELEKFRVTFQNKNESTKTVDCIIEHLNTADVIDRNLILTLDLTKSKADYDTLLDLASIVHMRTMIQLVKIQKLCGSTTSLEEWGVINADLAFNEIFEENYVSNLRTAEADYCVRKHLRDNGRLDDSIKV